MFAGSQVKITNFIETSHNIHVLYVEEVLSPSHTQSCFISQLCLDYSNGVG